ncbi:quinol:cytochrome C oxidoreductase [Cytophagales bacterium LB-30]|uniref:Quinol:cytochrome C oxidoreductase n=1 Tax=Shiella aurantiaca TaxID=3058365 RepID=A0ABT8F3X6_9BACT|nr:quinol:cytochrome C oxidoreductase [Shiella aurantiaca]MDN4165162.1 quinol:cytochrome C oxidoreductase [Shiella aurantiaca]
MIEERFEFTSAAKKRILTFLVAGIIALVLGIVLASTGGHHAEAGAHEGGHGAFHWSTRILANLWINNVYFTGIAIIGLFFVTIQYAAQAGWSAPIIRIPLAFSNWLPYAGVLMLGVFLLSGHKLFHWADHSVYEVGGAHYDAILDGKKAFFFWPLTDHPNIPVFFLARMVAYFVIWIVFFQLIKKYSQQEDINGGDSYWYIIRKYSAMFLVLFAITSSTSAWDWVMSADPHWFSTMFGWYVFASWWVTGLALIALIVVNLKDAGYLKMVNSNHLHDLGKFVFAFSIFWTYIWFSQFLLIYYANIPEETIYFVERLKSDKYAPVFFMNLFLNFVLPFLILMTRDAKRHAMFLKIVCTLVIVGHWFDFYLMFTPGMLKENGGFGFMEVGLFLIYGSAFMYVMLNGLSKMGLVAKNHPMLEESLHHHI